MSRLVEILANEFERPRELSSRVLNYIGGTYSVDHDAVGAFLVEELPKLEDYEIDLVLSPVFTPRLSDQAVFADILGTEAVPREQWSGIIEELVGRPTRAQLVTLDGRPHSITLREVTIERYVHRLRLEGTIPESAWNLIQRVPSPDDRRMLQAIARRAVWETEAVRDIFVRYLTRVIDRGIFNVADVVELLNLVEGRKPASLADLLARIPGWQEALRQQVDAGVGSKPFFSQDAERMHGGERDQRQIDEGKMSAKEKDLDFLVRLQQILAG